MQPGQVSDLVKSQFGFHIIKVAERKEATTTPLDQVRPQIQQQLSNQMADTQITEKARQMADQIKSAADLDKVAKAEGLTVQESGLFQREDPVPGLGASRKSRRPPSASRTVKRASRSRPHAAGVHGAVGKEGSVRAEARGSLGKGPR
jgi:hypothetical protein